MNLPADKIPTDATAFRKWADAACPQWPGGMSDAEWFCTMAEIGRRPQFTAKELLERVPAIAQKMADAVCAE
jgi:hypothetical protein